MRVIRSSQTSFKFGVKRFRSGQEVQGDRPDTQSPEPGQKENSSNQANVKSTREKLRTNPRRSATKLAADAGISQTSMRRILKEDLKTLPYKMQKRHELTPTHERMRVERCRHLLYLMEDDMLSNLVFSDEKNLTLSSASTIKMTVFGVGMHSWKTRRVSRRENPTYVMVWASVTDTRMSPFVFVPSGLKLNIQRYISDILEGELLPWAREHFEGAP